MTSKIFKRVQKKYTLKDGTVKKNIYTFEYKYKSNKTYMSYSKNIPMEFANKIRNPDLILIDKKTNKLILVIEIDGGIHDKKFFDTEKRNEEYFFAGVPLLIISKLDIETTIFDLVYKKVSEKLNEAN